MIVNIKGDVMHRGFVPNLEEGERSTLKDVTPNFVDRSPSSGLIPNLIYSSKQMRKIADTIIKIARTDVTTILYGESGTGKELVAKAIHEKSSRGEAKQPYVILNCAAIAPEIIDSELFGHERGSF